MKVKVAKWGNSLGIRLPSAAAQSAGVTVGSELDLAIEADGFRLRKPIRTSADLLAEMIAEMKRLGPENAPATVDWGPDRGSEIIDDAYSRGEITLEDILARKPAKKATAKPKPQSHARLRRR
jgi:antitoxin MazE